MPELPSGTVTFLFTDIEGSTRLLQELGDGYERVLVEHRRLLASAVEDAGGYVIDVQGDAFFAAFRRARDAVESAAAAQKALDQHAWPPGGEPRVRMGIDTGEPSIVEDGFVGLPVHRAARICSAAHGGQVLVSRTTRDLIEDSIPRGVQLIDLGDHHLKDVERPETLSQLVIEELPSSFPPLRAAASTAETALPFAGREGDLALAAQDALAAPISDSRRPGRRRVGRRFSLIGWLSFRRGRSRGRPNPLEAVGFRTYSMASIAPRDELQAAVRRLGSAIVVAARLAEDADRLLKDADHKALSSRLAEYRDSAHISESKLRAADVLAKTAAALDELAAARRTFDDEAAALESEVPQLRDQLFEARLHPERADDLTRLVERLREQVQSLSARLGEPYVRAASAAKEPFVPTRQTTEAGVEAEADFPPQTIPVHRTLRGASPLFEHLRSDDTSPGKGR